MARAPKVTWDRVATLIAAGHGSGLDEFYQPILQIKRWNTSPVSVQVVETLPPFRRRCHFFSYSEYHMALLFSWAGALIREQFPAWPWPHFHPEHGRNFEDDALLARSPGMIKICRDAGIGHGTFVGTDIPYIWSIDLCLTLPWIEVPAQRTVLASIKPLDSDRYQHIDPLDRGPEKLEGERRYARQLGVGYIVADRTQYAGPLFANLDLYRRAATLAPNSRLASARDNLLVGHAQDLQAQPIADSIRLAAEACGISHADATTLLHHCLWTQAIDCDLSRDIHPAKPPPRGGRRLRKAVRDVLTRHALGRS